METIAEKKTKNGRIYRYILKHDSKGYYWDGMCCTSYRRKQRKTVEAFATACHFDVYDTEL